MSFFARLFGRRKSGTHSAAGARARQQGQPPAPPSEPGRPLFRDEVAGPGGIADQGHGAAAGPACGRCGHANTPNSRFCSYCGAALRPGGEGTSETTSTISIASLEAYDPEATAQHPAPVLSPEAQAAVDALPAGSALLVVRRGPNSGSRFLLDSDVTTAGRHPQSDIFLDDVTVSRRHVEFRRTPEGGFTVGDVGSLNGTYVNREPIDSVTLSNGDEVQIGKYRMVYYAGRQGY
ncbi:FHA domain-containing protein [Streptomyces sp. DSM 44915]|uniref:FHA domain-containing protein n=1 Tax=Streptomyces chisholmiae TaxID=3075540 RepID=A0ABU2JL76_9ACTN|nr:FHA domain-containing protein [Streptomyces sp. DSM 44915]MDT0265737.1 FHA domain-containing protein [Streptomyces sp. DSM 44915]